MATVNRRDGIDIVRDLYEAGNRGHAERFVGLLSEDVEWLEPDGSPIGGTHCGRGAIRELLSSTTRRFDRFELAPRAFFADGDTVAVTVTERFRGGDGDDPDEVRVLHLHQLHDGRIYRITGFQHAGPVG